MTRLVGLLAAVLVAVAGCGVEAESTPEPLPPTTPVVLPPSVTREPVTPTPTPLPTPDPSRRVAPRTTP